MDTPQPRTASRPAARNRFLAALALFILWVCALGVLAVVSARGPEPAAQGIENK